MASMAVLSCARHALRRQTLRRCAPYLRPQIVASCIRDISEQRKFSTATETADAIIIGAGVIGNSIATELSRKGMKTISVEKQVDTCHVMRSKAKYATKLFICALSASTCKKDKCAYKPKIYNCRLIQQNCNAIMLTKENARKFVARFWPRLHRLLVGDLPNDV